jgi:hypothetical protein
MILRAPVSWLSALPALSYRISPVTPPSQAGTSSLGPSGALTLNAGTQKLTLPGALDAWIIIPPSIVQQVSGGNIASMPGEALELSQECAADFRGNWPAVFQALGFTSFVPTVGAIPTMCC